MSAFEKNLQTEVIKWLKTRGYTVYNVHGSEFNAGIPDILACICGRFVAFELKAAGGALRPLQKVNIHRIRKSGGIAEVVWSIDRVKEITETIENGKKWNDGPV